MNRLCTYAVPIIKKSHYSPLIRIRHFANTTKLYELDSQSQYERLVRRLYKTNLYNPVKLGLDNMQSLVQALGIPLSSPLDDNKQESINHIKIPKIIHVTGTNGKGSVCYKLAHALFHAGYKTGLFVSPHISSFRERIQILGHHHNPLSNSLISEQAVNDILPEIFETCEKHGIKATFFEITTALAFLHFWRSECDAVVLEVGLGGRLDATNVVSPVMSIITSIGLEHTRILGDTIEQIATEKAGIIKPHTNVILGPTVPSLVEDIAQKQHSPCYRIPDVFNNSDLADLERIDYDLQNSKMTEAALTLLHKHFEVPRESLEFGIQQKPPCRFEQMYVCLDADHGPELFYDEQPPPIKPFTSVILDVAHNPPALQELMKKLQTHYNNCNFRIVAGFSYDKDLSQNCDLLMSIVGGDASKIHLVEAANPRAAKVDLILQKSHKMSGCYNILEESASSSSSSQITINTSVSDNVSKALTLAVVNEEILVVCGSVFLMSEARESLGFHEPRDSQYISEVAGSAIKGSQENFGDSNPCPSIDFKSSNKGG